MSARQKRADFTIHVTKQNVRDAVAGDPKNCTFGQCAISREKGMDFRGELDPIDPKVLVEWVEHKDGKRLHHRGEVQPALLALNLLAGTDKNKKAFLKKFPTAGMNFVVTDHTVRANNVTGSLAAKPGETEEEVSARRKAFRDRQKELAFLRSIGAEPPPRRRRRPVRARFG